MFRRLIGPIVRRLKIETLETRRLLYCDLDGTAETIGSYLPAAPEQLVYSEAQSPRSNTHGWPLETSEESGSKRQIADIDNCLEQVTDWLTVLNENESERKSLAPDHRRQEVVSTVT